MQKIIEETLDLGNDVCELALIGLEYVDLFQKNIRQHLLLSLGEQEVQIFAVGRFALAQVLFDQSELIGNQSRFLGDVVL